jgi:hypothetical protein
MLHNRTYTTHVVEITYQAEIKEKLKLMTLYRIETNELKMNCLH